MFFLALLFSVLVSGFAAAAEPGGEETLPPLVTISTRVETPEENVANSVTVIDDKKIESRREESVMELLREVPGIDVVETGSRGNSASVFIRGANSNQTLVLVDGVEVNSTTLGAFDFAHLTTENVERIEVLRGAGGTLYGSQAIGGVINIITKKGEGPPSLTVSAAGGNGFTHREVAALRGSEGKLGYSLSVANLRSDGFRKFNDDYENLSASARLDYKVLDDATLRGIFHFTDTDVGLFNSNNFVKGNPGDPNAREARTEYLGKLEWEQKIFANWDYRVAGSIFRELLTDTDNVDKCTFFGFPCDVKSRDRFRPRTLTGEFQTNYRPWEWNTTTFGVEYKLRGATTNGGIDKAIRNLAYYLQEQFELLDKRLTLVPGVRLDDNQEFGRAWTPSFAAAYLFRDSRTKVKASYAKGFKAPTLNELFFPPAFGCPSFGNPELGPEKSWEVNAGFDQNVFQDRVKFGGTYFHREVKDLIEARPIPGNDQGCFRAFNVGRARFDGVEWNLAWKIFSFLGLNGNYTYLDWDTETGTLPRRPRHRGSIGLNYNYDALEVNLTSLIVGRRDDFHATKFTQIQMPGYNRVDLAAAYRLPVKIDLVKSLALFFKAENLFSRRYEEANGFRARPFNFLLGLQGVVGKN
ncbi:MAG TPA: TonB-dependent receptor [Verrucomicrobiae bacterium]|nr:TonB-dependent receptor [Verrucomicrobiae bacterium]